jgi:glycerol-3-phosphate acyltransferase PlsY
MRGVQSCTWVCYHVDFQVSKGACRSLSFTKGLRSIELLCNCGIVLFIIMFTSLSSVTSLLVTVSSLGCMFVWKRSSLILGASGLCWTLSSQHRRCASPVVVIFVTANGEYCAQVAIVGLKPSSSQCLYWTSSSRRTICARPLVVTFMLFVRPFSS